MKQNQVNMQGQAGHPSVFLLFNELFAILLHNHFAPLISWNICFDHHRFPGKFLSFPFITFFVQHWPAAASQRKPDPF